VHWTWWTIAALTWLTGWVFVASRFTSTMEGDAGVKPTGMLLLAFSASTCLLVFAIGRERGSAIHAFTLWAHHVSFSLLFLFLLASQYMQTQAWWAKRRSKSTSAVASAYRRLWILTELMPAPVAVAILLTGLRLIWDTPALNSPAGNLWLVVLIVGFGCFFFDGIFSFQPIVRDLHHHWQVAEESNMAAEHARWTCPVRRWQELQLLLHTLSFPVVFVFGVFRWNPPNPVTPLLVRVADRLPAFLPTGWPEVTMAILLWVAAGFAVVLSRALLARERFRRAPTARAALLE
jgi:hypothetical protein